MYYGSGLGLQQLTCLTGVKPRGSKLELELAGLKATKSLLCCPARWKSAGRSASITPCKRADGCGGCVAKYAYSASACCKWQPPSMVIKATYFASPLCAIASYVLRAAKFGITVRGTFCTSLACMRLLFFAGCADLAKWAVSLPRAFIMHMLAQLYFVQCTLLALAQCDALHSDTASTRMPHQGKGKASGILRQWQPA
jgi:hypothetical protein